jgi:hypothetical protein
MTIPEAQWRHQSHNDRGKTERVGIVSGSSGELLVSISTKWRTVPPGCQSFWRSVIGVTGCRFVNAQRLSLLEVIWVVFQMPCLG